MTLSYPKAWITRSKISRIYLDKVLLDNLWLSDHEKADNSPEYGCSSNCLDYVSWSSNRHFSKHGILLHKYIFSVLSRIILAGFFIHRHWKAMLISSLLARKINLPFVDVETLLQNSDYQIAVSTNILIEKVQWK